MADIAKIDGMERLQRKIKSNIRKMQQQGTQSVVVGYTASYALYVHEAVEMKLKGQPRGGGLIKAGVFRARSKKTGRFAKASRGYYWDPQGQAQAKFLEEPARTMRKELAKIVRQIFDKTRNLEKALVAAGLRLIRESTQKVPVDTGNLKASWFCRVEGKFGNRTIAKGAKSKG